MMTMQFDYADAAKPNSDDVQYYMEAVNEEEGEMGYSVYSVSDTSVSENLARTKYSGKVHCQITNLHRFTLEKVQMKRYKKL